MRASSTARAKLAGLAGENFAAIRRMNAPLEGVEVMPAIRASLAGDTAAIPPSIAEGFAAWRDLFDPDAEIDTSGAHMLEFGVLRGREGLRELWTRWGEDWESYRWTHSDYAEIDEHVVADVRIEAIGRTSGVAVAWHHAQVWTFRDGKIVRWSLFNDRAEALAALEAITDAHD